MIDLKTLAFAGLLACCGIPTRAVVQDKPDVHYISQTTFKIVLPAGSTEKDLWALAQEYFDKVYAKSTILKHFTVYRHAYGSAGSTVVVNMEFADWGDIEKFGEECAALEKAAWPDEAARKAMLKKMATFEDPYHHDEIYTISNTMRK